jgi:valacyclovir hydrolase
MPQVRVGEADIFYDEFGTGEPVLLIHGMLDTGRTHARQALHLSQQFRVIVPDLRGYGKSGPRPRQFPPDFYARDVADMAGLLDHLGLTEVRVLGFGDGAEVALLLALDYPERIRSLVVLDVTGAFSPAMLEALPQLGNWAATGSTNGMARRIEAFREYGQEGTQAIWESWKTAVRTIIARGGDISLSRAGGITCPVRIINGADDSVNTAAMSHTLAEAIPNAELHLVPDMGQLVHNKQSNRFNDEVLEWFNAH